MLLTAIYKENNTECTALSYTSFTVKSVIIFISHVLLKLAGNILKHIVINKSSTIYLVHFVQQLSERASCIKT